MLYFVLSLHFLAIDEIKATASSMFVQQEICNLAGSISRGCSKEVTGVRSVMDCARLCWRDTECVGASLDDRDICLHHLICHVNVPCSRGTAVSHWHRYMVPYCRHGTWDRSRQSCICHHGTIGERCNQYFTSCDDLLTSGNYATGSYDVIFDPLQDRINLIKAHCYLDISANKSRVALFINRGGESFNRTWNEYVNGFKVNNKILWAGLRAWHILGEAGIRHLYLTVRFNDGSETYVVYQHFRVTNEDAGYSMSAGDFSGSTSVTIGGRVYQIGDCLSPLRGVPFSTWDKDQDRNVEDNCASLAASGWWYNGSRHSPCRVLGYLDRLDILGVDVAHDPTLIDVVYMYLIK